VKPKYTLKLDASWRPIEVIDAFKGVSMVYGGRARPLEWYDTGPHPTLRFPSVIVLKSYVHKRQLTMTCNRKNVVWRDQNTCQYCGGVFLFKDLTMDHVIPQYYGGKKTWDNIVASCKKCNGKKGHKKLEEISMNLLTKPKKPAITIRDYYRHIEFPESWDKYT
jgi:5-methylcytosine-specific restriction endonuclease McrA